MNKHLHRIVFNAARGLRMVVQETARSTGKGASGATSATVCVAALAGALMSAPLHAQIVADPGAPGRQRPTLLVAPNGVPLVNIQTPSAAGVSRNTYSQFDVNAKGVILNNARTNAQTQLGGWVQGNPWLAGGSARVILNEVNSANPSQLRGYVEVAGQRAEVIIANPAGIQVNGGGFINASRATLTTGTPQFNAAGGLDGFLVRGGTVAIEGAGLDASKTDYAAILARAVQVNAGLWANELKVVAGANQVAVDGSAQAQAAPTGTAPSFALDVAALGGMYAGKITLVGSEAGLGVRNAGHIGAGAGGLVVTAAGRLENIGTLEGAKVELRSSGDIDNRGGTIRQAGTRELAITAPVLSNTAGGFIGAEPVATQPEAGTGGTGGGSTSGGSAGPGSVTPTTGTGTAPAASEPAPLQPAVAIGPGAIIASGSILNDGGRIYAGGEIGLATPRIDNSGGTLSVGTLAVSGERFSNAGGSLNVARAFSADVGRFDNSGGTLHAGSLHIASAGDLVNTEGTLTSQGDASLVAGGAIDNARGTVTAVGTLQMEAGETLHNAAGTLRANDDLVVAARNVDNRAGGEIVQTGGGTLRIDATQSLNNDGGRIGSNGADMHLKAATLGNAAGTLTHAGHGTLAIDAGRYDGAGGTVTGNGAVVVQAGDVDHAGGRLSAARITIDAGRLDNHGGEIVQTGTDAMQFRVAGGIDNRGGRVASGGAMDLATDTLDNTAGQVTSAGALALSATGAIDNRGGTLAANDATKIEARSLDNRSGDIAAVRGDLRLAIDGALDNSGGKLQAQGRTDLRARSLDNGAGTLSGHGVTVDTQGGSLDNTRGTLVSSAELALNSGVLHNDGGLIQSAASMAIDAGNEALHNTGAATHASGKGGIASGGTLTVRSGLLDNSAGFIGAHDALVADTQGLVNADGGLVLSQSTLDVRTQGANYDNRGGQTQARGALHLDAGAQGQVQNTGGLIRSEAALALDAARVDNTATQGADQGIEGHDLTIRTATLDNATGAVRATGNARIEAGTLVDNSGGLISARDTLRVVDPGTGVKTLAIVNTAGTLVADQGLEVDAGRFSGGGKVVSGRNLALSFAQDMVNDGEVRADGDLLYSSGGKLTNNGLLSAGQTLTVRGADVENGVNGEMAGGTATVVSASGTLTNHGLIDGHETRIDAGALVNGITGRVYGDHLSIAAGSLLNDGDGTHGGTIAARERLDIGAGRIENRNGALIFSAGDLAIGGALDAGRHATGRTGELSNHAATIEALGQVDIGATQLNNSNGGVTWTMVPGTATHVVEYAVPGSAQRWKAADVLFTNNTSTPGWSSFSSIAAPSPYVPGDNPNYHLLLPSPDYPLATFRPYYANSPKNSADVNFLMCHGGDGDSCENVRLPGTWYGIGERIWADFGATPPAAELPAGHPARTDPNITVGQAGVIVQVGDPGGIVDVLQPFDHPVTQAEYDQWQAYRQAHQKLDEATAKFVGTMTGGLGRPGRIYKIYDAWDYSSQAQSPVLQSSAPGKILAGGAMNIDVGQGRNDMSQILAGRALKVTGGTIVNAGKEVDATTTNNGAAIHSYVKSHTFGSDERVYESAAYNLTVPTTVTLAPGRQEGFVAVNGSGKTLDAVAAGAAGQGASGGGTVNANTRTSPIVEVPQAAGGATGSTATGSAPVLIRTSTPPSGLPTASLFHTANDGRYLVETDPRFAGYRQWLGSDYLLNALGLDPNNIQKRLGDGFYEQKLIREQIAQLTGYRYLEGFGNDEAQYTALMNAGATFAKQYGLRPGIALSAAQMAQLTSDIVWLVEQTVTLPDGSTQRVLVPQVYVRVKPGDIDGSGALLSGASVDVKLGGDFTNSAGTVAGRNTVRLNADNLNNLGGRITGHDVGITTRNDLNNIGGTIDAVSHLKLDVGRDLNVATTTRSATSSTGMPGDKRGVDLGAVVIDRVAGLYVTGEGGLLEADVGRNAHFAGAQVRSEGDVRLHAQGDIDLATVTTGRQEDIRWNGKMSRSTLESTETGTTIAAAGDARLRAEGNLGARAATLEAGDTLRLSAGNKLVLIAGEEQASAETTHATKSGLSHYSLEASSQQSTLVRTELKAQHIELQSGGNTVLGAVDAKAESLDIQTGGKLIFAAQGTIDAASRQEAKGDGAWVSVSGKGHVDETTQYSRLNVGKLTIDAKGGIEADLARGTDRAALAQQPGMAWVQQIANDPALTNSVHWREVQEAHDKWQYHQTSLGPVSSALVMLVVAVATAGTGTAAAGTAGTAAGGGTAATAGSGLAGALGLSQGATTILAGALQGGITTLVGQATISFVNNGGDLGKVFEELGSSASVKNLLTAMATGGALAGLNMDANGFPTVDSGKQLFMDQLTQNVKAGAASALIKTAIEGGSLQDNLAASLKGALLGTVAAQWANEIGDLKLDAFTNKLAHAMAGCVVGAASAGNGAGCASGALGAAVGEMTAEALGRRTETVQVAALMSGLAIALAGGDAGQVNLAATAGGNAAANNYLNHDQWAEFAQDLQGCGKDPVCEATQRAKYAQLSKDKDAALAVCDKVGNCDALKAEVASGRAYQIELVKSGALPNYVMGGFDLQQLGLKLSNQPAYREQVGNSVVAQLVCQLDQKACDVQSAKMALGLGVALAGGPAASYLLSSLPTIAVAAKMTAAACAAAPVLCANRAGLVVADLLASEALGGASLAGGTLGLKVLSKVEAEAEALRLIAQRNATMSAKIDNAILNRADTLLYNDLAARAKIRPDTSMDAIYAAKTDTTILADNKFDMAHVLTGEINASGKATGYHAEIAANGEARITPGAALTRNANGTYEAPVQVWDGASLSWVDKRNISTFFPPAWSEARITYEVTEAFKVKIPDPKGGWTGTTPSGIDIRIFWDAKNQRTTFYPNGK